MARRLTDERPTFVAIRTEGRRDRESGQVSLGRGRKHGRGEPVARAVRIGVEQLVLRERHARVHVDQAVDAADPRICGDPTRVVVQGGEVPGRDGRSVGSDRDGDRCEFAFAERVAKPVEGGARRQLGRQDARVRRVETNVQEWVPEEQEEGERRDEHPHRVAHDPAREPRPRPFGSGPRRDAPDGHPIEVLAEHRQQRRQEGQCGEDGEADDDRPREPDRAQDHELEEHQPEQAQQHRQPAEEHGPPARRDRDPDGLAHPVRLVRRALGELFPESTGEQQRIVDTEAEPEQRREVEDEDAHRGDLRDEEDRPERDQHAGAAHDQRYARRDDRPEHDEKRQRGQRQRDDLAALEVPLADALDIAVEGGTTGELDGQARCLLEPLAKDR